MTSDVFGVLCFHDLLILDRGIIIGTSNSLSTSHTPLICSFNVTLVGSWPRLTSSNYLLYSSVESIKTNVKHTTCEFFRAMLSDQKFVQLIMGYLCRLIPMNIDSQHRISKRQYSLQSVIYLFKEYSCDISETLKDILDVAQSKFSYLNKDSPFRKYVDWNLINEIAPQYLCCFADAMNTHTSSHVSSSSGVESFIFLVVLSASILVLM